MAGLSRVIAACPLSPYHLRHEAAASEARAVTTDLNARNRLALETSPYLLQHRDNPVHWWAWGDEALAEARRLQRPILLSVGYAACHWCHVMAHESFEDAATAEVMNALYVNIKVDREERPDVDALYMRALHTLGEQGGWPLTMFLTPDGEPFFGGTYFPPSERYGRPSFQRVLTQVARVYREEPAKVRGNADAILVRLREGPSLRPHAGAQLDESAIADLARSMVETVDRTRGGIEGAPKFPQTSFFWLLWKAGIRYNLGDCRDAVVTTLRNLCQGGIYDHIGGGFARYSVDADWLVPHFEKMLYDNALLVSLLTEVWAETREPLFEQRIHETIDWLITEMRTPEGGFAASYDADSEGHEGKFYVWTPEEVKAVLGDEDGTFFCAQYDITETGNFEGKNIPNRLAKLALEEFETEQRLTAMHGKLYAKRKQRVPPGWDDKVLTDWNGLAITALVQAGLAFDRPDWIAFAAEAHRFVLDHMRKDGRLLHAWRSGSAKAPAISADYANMMQGALALYEATDDRAYLADAQALRAVLDQHYRHPAGGYCLSADDTTDLIVRLRHAHDDATPNANGTMIANLVALSLLEGDTSILQDAEAIVAGFVSDLAQNATGHTGLVAGVMDLARPQLVVIIDPARDRQSPLMQAVRSLALPGAVIRLVADTADQPADSPLYGKLALQGRPTAYVCLGPQCAMPTTDPSALIDLLRANRSVAGATV
jgi:uncharacterized protein